MFKPKQRERTPKATWTVKRNETSNEESVDEIIEEIINEEK